MGFALAAPVRSLAPEGLVARNCAHANRAWVLNAPLAPSMRIASGIIGVVGYM